MSVKTVAAVPNHDHVHIRQGDHVVLQHIHQQEIIRVHHPDQDLDHVQRANPDQDQDHVPIQTPDQGHCQNNWPQIPLPMMVNSMNRQ